MKQLKILIVLLLAVLVPAALWFAHENSKPIPKVVPIDRIAGPKVEYSKDRLAHQQYIIDQQYILGASDQVIVDRLKQKENPLYESENITVTYNKGGNLFVSEVQTIRIEPAKREGVNWFRAQGLSLEAICVLPVTFTISDPSAEALRGLDIKFDPLPSECY